MAFCHRVCACVDCLSELSRITHHLDSHLLMATRPAINLAHASVFESLDS
eukprot:m.353517 g.353517  ORF g.353517 m.353517 type:complete len:50 (+) comp16781_c0_seq1:1822-1971(+)